MYARVGEGGAEAAHLQRSNGNGAKEETPEARRNGSPGRSVVLAGYGVACGERAHKSRGRTVRTPDKPLGVGGKLSDNVAAGFSRLRAPPPNLVSGQSGKSGRQSGGLSRLANQ